MIPPLFQTLRKTIEQPTLATRLTVAHLEDQIYVAVEYGQITTAHYGALSGEAALRAMYELPEALFAPPSVARTLWVRDCAITFDQMIQSLYNPTFDRPQGEAMDTLARAPGLMLGYAVKNGTPRKFTRPVSSSELVRAFTYARLPLIKRFSEESRILETGPHQRSRLSNGVALYALDNGWTVIAHLETGTTESAIAQIERNLEPYAGSGRARPDLEQSETEQATI